MTYGCKDRAPYVSVMPAQDGYYMDGYTRTPRMVSMPFRMSPTCQYRETELGEKDKACDGCKWKAGAGTEVAAGPVPVGDSLAGVREVEGEPSGDQGAGDVERASATAEQRSADQQARAAEKLEAIYPGAAIYRQVKES